MTFATQFNCRKRLSKLLMADLIDCDKTVKERKANKNNDQ